MSVKMRTTCTWTGRPYEALLYLGIGFGLCMRRIGGGFEDDLAGSLEPLVRYHPCNDKILTLNRYPVKEQFQVGSLTGAVAS